MRRIQLALTAALFLSVGAAGTAAAAVAAGQENAPQRAVPQSQQTATSCPTPGHRLKSAEYADVYVVGPDSVLYYIPDSATYFKLWDSWSGVQTVSESVLETCYSQSVYMQNARLVKVDGSSAVYIYDASQGYRWIKTQSIFDKYGFSSAKIEHWDSIDPSSISSNPWWE
jgi:hypothetical protein